MEAFESAYDGRKKGGGRIQNERFKRVDPKKVEAIADNRYVAKVRTPNLCLPYLPTLLVSGVDTFTSTCLHRRLLRTTMASALTKTSLSPEVPDFGKKRIRRNGAATVEEK